MTREWLEADGRGGFAMGTADGIRTRRYHGLLVTAAGASRTLLVVDLEVFVETARGRWALSSHRYRGDVVYPDGASRIAAFAWQPWPRWEWALPDGTRVAGELVVEQHRPAVALRWTRIAGAGPAQLSVRPLLAGRDYHATHHENAAFRFDVERDREVIRWRPYDGIAIAASGNGRYEHAPDWYRDFELADEAARGLDHAEDLASPGSFTFDLSAPARLALCDGGVPPDVEPMFEREAGRRRGDPLTRSAGVYIVHPGRTTIIAGYPWFSDWGRDTFISLRGLCLATGRRDEARAILLGWARLVEDGMMPNRFDETTAKPELNSVDAALWFVIAADAYLAGEAGGERHELEATIAEIVDGYLAGTRHRIKVDPDGLLAAGEPGLQLTWMDAKCGDEVITPRIGKPVEVNALWLNALAIAGRRELFERGKKAFAERFWNAGMLYDVIDVDHVPGVVDPTCRPNQIFAVGGLPHQLIDGERARDIVDTVERKLWTPAGPRSLADDDPRYHGRYVGGPLERDRAYHNGPVWPWLAGAFVEAWVRVRGDTGDARREARRRFLEPLLARLDLAGLGHLSEICDGDPPHAAAGCPFQAWSVAELIRLDRVVLTSRG